MVWKETCAVDERMCFAMAIAAGEDSFAATYCRFGVSRRTGCKLFERYRLEAFRGLRTARARRTGVCARCRTRLPKRACRSGGRIRAGAR